MSAARATDSALVRRTVEEAERLGLVVSVTREELYGMASVSVVVKRPHVEPVTLLDVVDNARGLHLHALRSPGDPRWTHAAWSMGYTAASKLSRLKLVPYVVRGLSEGVGHVPSAVLVSPRQYGRSALLRALNPETPPEG